jgi:hypothetical protein
MQDSDEGSGASGARPPKLPSFGEALSRITAHFTLEGALGLLLIDAADFSEIERSYGAEAHQRSMHGLGALVVELIADRIGINDLVVAGETGRNEILVLVFREANEVDFYKRELPELRTLLSEGLAGRASRVAYPYLKQAPTLHIGIGASLRNPTIGAETQVRAALDEGRSEARLNERLAAGASSSSWCSRVGWSASTSRSSRWPRARCSATRRSPAARRAPSCTRRRRSSRRPASRTCSSSSTACAGRARSTAPATCRGARGCS